MTIAKAARAALLLLTTLATGCSAAGPAAPAEPPPPATSVGVSAAPSAGSSAPAATALASAAPSAAPAAPPAEGLTRRYYRLHQPGDKDLKGGVPVSIDVPPEWGVTLDRMEEPEFVPCKVESPVFGRLSLVSLSCGADTALDACIDRVAGFQFGKDELATATVEKSGPLRRWISVDRDVKGRRQVHARLFAVDPASRSAVMCLMLLSDGDQAFLPDYKKACETLALNPPGQHDEPPVKVTARPRATAAGAPTAPELPNAKAVTDVALGFFKAMQARDLQAANRFLPVDGDCVEKDPKEKARCKQFVGQIHQNLGKLVESFPPDFQPGTVELRPMDEAPGLVSVKIHGKGDECGEGRGLMVREMNKKPLVVFAIAVAKAR